MHREKFVYMENQIDDFDFIIKYYYYKTTIIWQRFLQGFIYLKRFEKIWNLQYLKEQEKLNFNTWEFDGKTIEQTHNE